MPPKKNNILLFLFLILIVILVLVYFYIQNKSKAPIPVTEVQKTPEQIADELRNLKVDPSLIKKSPEEIKADLKEVKAPSSSPTSEQILNSLRGASSQ